MGLFSSPPKVYKPAADVDLGPGSDELYISPNVKGLLPAHPGEFSVSSTQSFY
jgi:hypothetical protein